MSLSYLLSCANQAPCSENFITSPGSHKSNIIAMAFVDKGELEAEDVTTSLLKAKTTTADGVITIVRALQLGGKAFFIPSGRLNGKKPKPDEKVASLAYGLSTDPKPTGEVTNMLQFTYEYFYSTQTVEWFNYLRKNISDWDIVFWTQNAVHLVTDDITVHNVGYEITGNAGEIVTGGFDVRFLSDGEPVPYFGSIAKDLEGFTSLTIVDPVFVGASYTKQVCSSDCNVWAAAVGGASSTTAQFSVTGQSACLTWHLHLGCSDVPLLANAVPVKIDSISGLMTITALPANTRTRLRVVAVSNSCVVGEYCIELVTKTA